VLDRSHTLFQGQPPAPLAKNAFALERLRQAVLWCELAPGATVSEDALVRQFRLGRAAVRSALARLAAEGFVAALPRRGWQIVPITGALLEGLVAARLQVEPSLPQTGLTAADLGRLRALAGFMTPLAQAGDPQSLLTARHYDRQYMDVLASRAGAFIARWLAEAWSHGERMIRFFERADSRYALPDRQKLTEALAKGDGAAAAAELGAEIERFRAFITVQILRTASWPAQPGQGRRKKPGAASSGRSKRIPSTQQGDNLS
jgi:DNA-binding GntR family transcriptional regulator